MNIKIITPDNLNELENHAVVVLDIFRASNTIMAFLRAGASKVYLLAELEAAFALNRLKPQALLAGERKGIMVAGMQAGNSPAAASQARLNGQEVILTTSAGTQAVGRLLKEAEGCLLVFGSFANAGALISFLRAQTKPVALLPMGLEAREPALEDDLAAWYLRQRLLGNEPDFAQLKPKLLHCPGAARLRGLGQLDDLAMCAQLDNMPVIPVVRQEGNLPPFAQAT